MERLIREIRTGSKLETPPLETELVGAALREEGSTCLEGGGLLHEFFLVFEQDSGYSLSMGVLDRLKTFIFEKGLHFSCNCSDWNIAGYLKLVFVCYVIRLFAKSSQGSEICTHGIRILLMVMSLSLRKGFCFSSGSSCSEKYDSFRVSSFSRYSSSLSNSTLSASEASSLSEWTQVLQKLHQGYRLQQTR